MCSTSIPRCCTPRWWGSRTPCTVKRLVRRSICTPGPTSAPDALREYVKARVAAYKYPRQVWLAALPIGPTGKILKREIVVPAEVTATVPR